MLGVGLGPQHELPLIDALTTAAGAVRAPFFFPGHKMGRAAPLPLQRRLHLGPRILRHDLPELPELDNLFAPEGPILRAQELAADAFGAGRGGRGGSSFRPVVPRRGNRSLGWRRERQCELLEAWRRCYYYHYSAFLFEEVGR